MIQQMQPRTRLFKLIAVALFVAAVPVFLVTTNLRWVINFPQLYSYGFDKYNIPWYTGIERDELISAGRQIRDYFNNDEELIRIQVEVRGVRVMNLFNQREVLHMRDVKGLVRGVYRVQEATGAYLLAFVASGFFLWRRRFAPQLARYTFLGGALTLALVLFVGLLSVVGFEQLFLLFHLVSFSNDLWQLDPTRDYLLAMFPEGFFFDATMLIALSTVAEAALMAGGAWAYLRWRGENPVQARPARLKAGTQPR